MDGADGATPPEVGKPDEPENPAHAIIVAFSAPGSADATVSIGSQVGPLQMFGIAGYLVVTGGVRLVMNILQAQAAMHRIVSPL